MLALIKLNKSGFWRMMMVMKMNGMITVSVGLQLCVYFNQFKHNFDLRNQSNDDQIKAQQEAYSVKGVDESVSFFIVIFHLCIINSSSVFIVLEYNYNINNNFRHQLMLLLEELKRKERITRLIKMQMIIIIKNKSRHLKQLYLFVVCH